MAESTLSLTYWDLVAQVANMLSFARSPSGNKLVVSQEIVESGYRQFLFPDLVGRDSLPHRWSFLSPVAELTLRTQKESGTATLDTVTLTDTSAKFLSYGVLAGDELEVEAGGAADAGTYEVESVTSETVLVLTASAGSGESDYYVAEPAWRYPLPDDFGGLRGVFTYPVGQTVRYVTKTDEGLIRRLRGGSDRSGNPSVCAVRPKAQVSTTGQRFEVIFYPTPSTIHILTYPYDVVVNKLGTARSSRTGTISGAGSTVLTDDEAEFLTDGCVAGDKVVLTDTSGPTEGIYTVATVESETEITLSSGTTANGAVSYAVTPEKAYPLGGMQYSELLLEICLGIAEQRGDDTTDYHTDRGQVLLEAAVGRDRANAPDTVGYNADGSDGPVSVSRIKGFTFEGASLD